MRKIRSIGVAGAGTMGAGIAQLALHSGLSVFLYDADEKALSRAHAKISRGLEKRGQSVYLARLHFKNTLKELNSADCAIEAAPENLEIKHKIFHELSRAFPKDCLLATNTSSLSVSEIAKAAAHPERVVGLHFFNPPPIMKLVEVVPAKQSAEETVAAATALAQAMGKTPVRAKDSPGFIANRVSRPFYTAAMEMLERGEGTPSSIDRAMREQGHFKMGPFELMDFIGLDVNVAIARVVFEGLGQPQNLRALRVEEELVKRGCLGKKNSKGFYVYGGEDGPEENPVLKDIVPSPSPLPHAGADARRAGEGIVRMIVGGVIKEANRAYAEEVASRDEIDTVMKIGMSWPKGPFEWEREFRGS